MSDMEDKKKLETILETLSSSGWSLCVEDFKDQVEIISSIDNCSDEKELFINKGRLEIIRAVINLKDTVEMQLENME